MSVVGQVNEPFESDRRNLPDEKGPLLCVSVIKSQQKKEHKHVYITLAKCSGENVAFAEPVVARPNVLGVVPLSTSLLNPLFDKRLFGNSTHLKTELTTSWILAMVATSEEKESRSFLSSLLFSPTL